MFGGKTVFGARLLYIFFRRIIRTQCSKTCREHESFSNSNKHCVILTLLKKKYDNLASVTVLPPNICIYIYC